MIAATEHPGYLRTCDDKRCCRTNDSQEKIRYYVKDWPKVTYATVSVLISSSMAHSMALHLYTYRHVTQQCSSSRPTICLSVCLQVARALKIARHDSLHFQLFVGEDKLRLTVHKPMEPQAKVHLGMESQPEAQLQDTASLAAEQRQPEKQLGVTSTPYRLPMSVLLP